jgi:hypothetical protein
MAEEIIEEEVIEEVIAPEDDYESEYDKAWSDEEEELEQLNTEEETTDEIVEEQVEEDSSNEEVVAEDKPIEEATKEDLEVADNFAETLKWNKQEIPVTRDELISLAQKGFDADKKWREASLSRPMKELVDSNNLTAEDIQMFIDAKNGKAEALALMAEKAGIDMYDAEKKDYAPVVEVKNYELDDVIAEINQDEAIATQMNDYVSSVPQGIKDVLTENPDVLRGLNMDMKQGIAQKIMPEVIKQLAINSNQDFVKLYQHVGKAMYSKEQAPVAAEKPTRIEPTREEKRKMSISKKNSAPTKQISDDYDASWDDDKHFNDVLARLSGF